jgi:YD repeat-containing protein
VVTTYTYDAAGRMLSKTLDPTGNNFVTTYTWDGRGQQLSVTDPGLVVTTYAYDADGNVLTMVKAAGELNLTTTYTWDGAGHQLTMLEGAGTSTTRTTQYTYDNLGRLTQTVVDPGDVNKGYLNLITAYAYDGNDNLIVQTDADGNTTYRGYNEANQVEYVVSPAGPATAKQGAVTRNWYDADGHLTATTAYATLVDTSSLGAAPSLTQLAELATASADDRTTYTVYNNDGEVGYTIDAEGYVTLTQYDSNGRETEVLAYANAIPVPDWMQSALRISQAGSYDEITSVVSNAGNTEQNAQATLYLRDNDGQVRFVVKQDTVNGQRLGMVSEQRYDADGRVIASIDYGTPLVLNDSTDWLYDQLSTSSVEQTLAGTTNVHATYYVYSNVGTLSFVIDPDNYVTQNNYDKSGNLTSVHRWLTAITLPATLTTHNVGTAVQAANADDNCQLTVYNYDRASRLIQVQDNLLGVSDLTANAVYTYDALGQKTSYTNRDGDTWTYTYDAAGRLQTETTPQVGVSYYNSPNSPTDNTLTTIYTEIVTEYTYDNDGNVTSSIVGYLNNGNTGGVVGTEATSDTDTEYPFVPMRTMSYVYDRAGHQTEIISPAVSSGNTPPQVDDSGEQEATDPPPVPSEPPPLPGDTTTSSVSYDAFGDAVVNQDINKNYEYKVYNKAGQLAYDIDGDGYVTAYAYDAYGNQTQVTRYATAINFTAISGWSSGQPITIEDIQKSGVLTADANPTDGDRTLTTTYDQLNHKVQVQQSSIACVSPTGTQDGSASPTTVYTYDAYGNVVSTAVLVSPGLTQAPPDNPPVPPTGDASDESTDSDQPLAVWAVTYDYYDALGQKTLEVDPMGYVTTWAYDARGNVTTTTQYAQAATTGWSSTTPPALPAAGTEVTGFDRTTTYTYDAIGRKISETDTGGYSTLSGSTQSIGQQSLLTTWNYVGGGNRVVETTVYGVTPDGATTVTYYDALHRVQQVLQPNRDELLSNWQTTLANSTGEDLTSSNLYGGSAPDTFFSYDVFGDVVSAETSNSIGGDQISYRHYDAMGLVTSETNADGTTYTYTYDFAGNLTSTTYTLTGNSDTSSITTRYNYDANNQRVNSFTDRYSQTTGWVSTDSATYVQYNAFGEIVAKGDGAGLSGVGLYELFYHYDDAGNLISATDPKTGAQHSYQYDLRGDLLYDTTPVTGSSTASVYVENQYDLDGRVTSQTTPSSLSSTAEATRAVTHTYDRWGNVLSTTDANLNKTIYEYDSQNHLIKQIEPKVDVTDQYGNTTTTSTPTKRWSYDLNGNLTGVVDENNYVTTNAYNAAGELISTTDAMGATTYYAYDGLGNQVAKQTLVDDSNQQFTWHITWQSFDALGQVTAEGDFTPSLDGVTRVKNTQQSYLLDENGNRRQVTDALNETSYYSYDSQGRLLSSQTPRQNYYNVSDVFTYDINGNKIGETDANGNTQTWNYDYYSRLQTHVDMSGATYHYSYDQYSGLLTGETSTWDPTNSTQQTSPQSDPGYLPASDKTSGNGLIQSTESYTYYADGQVATVTEKTGAQTTTTTSYQYDAVGNETDQLTATIDGAGGTVDTDTTSSYDSHNRLIDVTETNEVTHAVMMRTDYKYDAAGNRRAVTVHTGYGGTPDQSNWFTYDKDNRVLVSGGDLVGTQILIADRAGSASQTYDDAGDIKSTSTTDGTQTYTQTFTYDVRGEQTGSVLYGGQVETKQYDADGRLIADVYKYAPGTWVPVSTPDQPDGRLFIGGWLESATTYYYDADGDVYATFDYGRKNTDWDAIARQGDYAGQSEIPSSPPSLQDAAGNPPASYGVLAMESHVSHWDPNTGTGGYDAEDNVLVYTYSVANGYTTTYRVNYLKQDGYLEESTTGTSDQPNVLKTTDTSIYDAFGRRIAIDTYSQGQSTHQVRAFAYDANGQILERRDGSAANDTTFSVTNNGGYAIQHYAYVNGQQIGDVDEHGTVDVLSGVTGFSNSDTGTTNYVVQDGDTLQSIAQQIYGDSSLWYVVADANGLTGDGDLVEGQTLKLPQVTTNSNTSTTFKPYNPNEISGSTTPTLPQAPQPAPSGGHSCNTLAEIVVIAVVIVASIYTAGAAAEAFGAADSTAIGTTAVTTTGATFSTGASVLAGSSVAGLSTGAEIAAAAIGGAVGNVAGQLAGDALGVHQGFSLGEALAGGLTAGATAGIGGAISSDSALLSANGGLTAEGYALEGAADYGAGVAANKLVGQPQTFSWANLVASAVGSTLTGEAHLPTNTQLAQGESSGNFFEDLGGSLVNGAIDSETARLLGGNAANGNQIAIDAFGNALGNAAIAGIRTENARSQAQQQAQLEATTQQMQSSFSNELQGDIDAQTGQYIQSQMDAASTADFALMDAERGNVVNGITGNVANDYELGAPGKPSQGYPVPAGYTNDPAIIKALYQNTLAYVGYENQQANAGLPPVPGDPDALVDYNHALQQGLYPQNSMQTLDAVNVVATSENVAAASMVPTEKGGFWGGVGHALFETVYQPLAMTYDLEQTGYEFARSVVTGEAPRDIDYASALGEFAAGGAGTGDILIGGVKGAVMTPVRLGYAIGQGNAYAAGEELTNLGLLLGGGVGGADSAITARMGSMLSRDLAKQAFVYRAIPEDLLQVYMDQGSISGPFGKPTYFSLEGGATPIEHKIGAQLENTPEVLLKIPVSALETPTVPRPDFGTAWFGREYTVSSYPELGAGGYRQFTATTNTFSEDWIVKGWGKR